MKFNPTYGATPAMVGRMPLYSAVKPPSVLYITPIVPNMPGSFFSAFAAASLLKFANDADWIDSRVRTMSSGYVKVTDVIPAIAPHTNLRSGGRGAPGEVSKY